MNEARIFLKFFMINERTDYLGRQVRECGLKSAGFVRVISLAGYK